MFGEGLAQQFCLAWSGTHPPSVNRVESTQSVADSDKSIRCRQLFIVALHAGWESMMCNGRQLLCISYDSSGKIGVQLFRKSEESFTVSGWIVPEPADQTNEQCFVFDPDDVPAASESRRGAYYKD